VKIFRHIANFFGWIFSSEDSGVQEFRSSGVQDLEVQNVEVQNSEERSPLSSSKQWEVGRAIEMAPSFPDWCDAVCKDINERKGAEL
jgi:hypothetical protein